MRFYYALATFLVFLFLSCAHFVPDDNRTSLEEMGKNIYTLNKNISVDGKKLNKGDSIRIVVTFGDDWIKVHGYPAVADKLKVERLLLLYLFDEDFEGKKFSYDFFSNQLNELVTLKGRAE